MGELHNFYIKLQWSIFQKATNQMYRENLYESNAKKMYITMQ